MKPSVLKPSVLHRSSLIVCLAAIAVAIYQSEHAYDYMVRQEWLPEEPRWAPAHSQFSAMMGSITNSSRSSASQLTSAIKERMGSHIDIQQFQLFQTLYSRFSQAMASDPSRIGLSMAEKGLRAKHPVVIIPGFVTSGLELWRGLECFKGLDPDGIRVRNAQGLDAVDFFFPGYDVWASVITSLADIGYDTNSMVALPYDWRLSIPNLEFRDAYYSRLRSQIELFYIVYNERVLIVAHSWGDNVARSFLAWMEATQPGWVDKHVAVHFNVAGPTLGVPKALTALLSGELSETANLLGLASVIGEQLLGKEERTLAWRTWGSTIGMLPAGGTRIWGNSTWAPDDSQVNGSTPTASGSVGAFLSVVEDSGTGEEKRSVPLDIEQATGALIKEVGPVYSHHVEHWSAAKIPAKMSAQLHELFGQHEVDAMTAESDESARPGSPVQVPDMDPLVTPLPHAPRMRMYCGYGHGLPTERAYHYRYDSLGLESDQCPASEPEGNPGVALGQISTGKHWNLDSSVDGPGRSIANGVVLGNGDGTVPLVSLGYMCASAWQSKELNPSGIKVVVREYSDESSLVMPRGGPGASSHVEVLRNQHFLKDLLHAAAGWYDEVDVQQIDSRILEVAELADAGGGHAGG